MKKILNGLGFGLLLAIAGSVHAAIIPIQNGDFTAGTTGWHTQGDVSIVSSYKATDGAFNTFTTITAPDGSPFALVTAGNPTSSITSDSFAVAAGDTINFDWFCSAEDYLPFNDFCGFSLDLVSAGVTIDADVLASVSSLGDFGLTGWNPASIIAPVGGDLALRFNVVNGGGDWLFDTAGGLNNVYVKTVPEPGTLGLMGLGLVCVGFAARRRKVNQIDFAKIG